MYRVIFVENVLLQAQNGKKIEKSEFWGYSKVIRVAVFWITIKNRTILEFFNRRQISSSIIYYRTVIYKIWTVFELLYKQKNRQKIRFSTFFCIFYNVLSRNFVGKPLLRIQQTQKHIGSKKSKLTQNLFAKNTFSLDY